ncbi:hypothetical protein D3C80_917560 [compost metagenome]
MGVSASETGIVIRAIEIDRGILGQVIGDARFHPEHTGNVEFVGEAHIAQPVIVRRLAVDHGATFEANVERPVAEPLAARQVAVEDRDLLAIGDSLEAILEFAREITGGENAVNGVAAIGRPLHIRITKADAGAEILLRIVQQHAIEFEVSRKIMVEPRVVMLRTVAPIVLGAVSGKRPHPVIVGHVAIAFKADAAFRLDAPAGRKFKPERAAQCHGVFGFPFEFAQLAATDMDGFGRSKIENAGIHRGCNATLLSRDRQAGARQQNNRKRQGKSRKWHNRS